MGAKMGMHGEEEYQHRTGRDSLRDASWGTGISDSALSPRDEGKHLQDTGCFFFHRRGMCCQVEEVGAACTHRRIQNHLAQLPAAQFHYDGMKVLAGCRLCEHQKIPATSAGTSPRTARSCHWSNCRSLPLQAQTHCCCSNRAASGSEAQTTRIRSASLASQQASHMRKQYPWRNSYRWHRCRL